jgi:hypothetical protein
MAASDADRRGVRYGAVRLRKSRTAIYVQSGGLFEDVRTWDMFRWAVIVLLALPLVFLLSLAGDIRSEMAMLKEEQTAGTGYLARMTKEIADTRVSLTKAITDTRSGLQGETAKMNTKIDMRLQQATTPSQPPPAPPKPGVKPRLR